MASAITERKNSVQGTRVSPSLVSNDQPFSLDQELTTFGRWTSEPIWVPPKDSSAELAKALLRDFGPLTSREKCWHALTQQFKSEFTQVREIELPKASIRLPRGRVFVSITEREQFDQITDKIPGCVKTRLDEFLAGPGKKRGVKVYYLKPLCVEVGDQLIFTTPQELSAIVRDIQNEVFNEFRRRYFTDRAVRLAARSLDAIMAGPRALLRGAVERKKKALEAYEAKLEFQRRKIALRAANAHRKYRSDGCSFDDMLQLTNPLERTDVINQYTLEKQLSEKERRRLLAISAVATLSLPWFIALPIVTYYAVTAITLSLSAPVVVCDPAFVAEMPGSNGVVLKIGHFDEIAGVTHVEI